MNTFEGKKGTKISVPWNYDEKSEKHQTLEIFRLIFLKKIAHRNIITQLSQCECRGKCFSSHEWVSD